MRTEHLILFSPPPLRRTRRLACSLAAMLKTGWLAVIATLLLLAMVPSAAQTMTEHLVGASYDTVLATRQGYRVPLPPGKWSVVDSFITEPSPSHSTATVVLQAADTAGTIPFAIVRYSVNVNGTRWGDLCAESGWTTVVHRDSFGTLSSQNRLKCQHVRLIGLVRTSSAYGKRAFDALIARHPSLENSGFVATTLQVSEAGSHWVRVETLARQLTPGLSRATFREAALRGDPIPWLDAYKRWGADYLPILHDAVFNKRESAVAAFVPPGGAVQTPTQVASGAGGSVNDQIRQMTTDGPAAKDGNEATQRIRDAVSATASAPAAARPAPSPATSAVNDQIRQMTGLKDTANGGDEATKRIRDAASGTSGSTAASTPRPATPPAAANAQDERDRLAAQARQKEEQARIAQAELARERERQRVLEEARAKEQAENERLAAELARLRQEMDKRPDTSARPVMANRKALIIGNDNYKHVAPLKAAREDARAMADGLKRVGYAVTLRLDLSEREMKAAIRNFVGTIEGGDEVAFFFAGHGVQIGSANYLIPVDINGEGEAQIRDEAIALQRILDDFSDKKAKFTLAVIDACRDNPFKSGGRAIGSSSRGLAPTTAATGQMVIFSAGAGQRALDNLGDKDTSKNGVFTRVFVKEMQRRAVSIDKIVRDTRSEVVRLAKTVGHEQVPAIYDQVVGEFFFSQ